MLARCRRGLDPTGSRQLHDIDSPNLGPEVIISGAEPMNRRKAFWRLVVYLASIGAVCAFQRPFREYPGVEYDNFPLPPDWRDKAEFAFARLMYPEIGF